MKARAATASGGRTSRAVRRTFRRRGRRCGCHARTGPADSVSLDRLRSSTSRALMFRKTSSTRSLRIGSRGCADRGSATFADGLRELPTTAASRFSRSAPSSGRCSSPTQWWRTPRPARRQNVSRSRPGLRSTDRGRDDRRSREALRAFADLGTALLGARDTGEALDTVIAGGPGWEGLGDLVAEAAAPCEHGRVGSVE